MNYLINPITGKMETPRKEERDKQALCEKKWRERWDDILKSVRK